MSSNGNIDEHRTIDHVRQRLHTLHRAIDTLYKKGFIAPEESTENTGLPSWNHINQTQNAITNNLLALQTLMSENQEFMRSAHVYPNASYPWAQEIIANQLLRKRLQPEDQNWVDRARREGEALDAHTEEPIDAFTKSTMAIDDQEDSGQGMSGEDWVDLWDFAAPAAQDIFKDVWVRETEDDDEDEDDEDEGVGQGEKGKAKMEPFESAMPGMPLEDVLRYMSAGAMVGVGGPPTVTG